MHDCEKKECKHEHVKFCPKCLKPYCLECGKEWEEKCYLTHYPWYPTYIQPNITPTTNPWYTGDPPYEIYKVTCANSTLKPDANINYACSHK
jgi:hypothetical protein